MNNEEYEKTRDILTARAGEDDYDEELCAGISSLLLAFEESRELNARLVKENRAMGAFIGAVGNGFDSMNQILAT